MLAQRLRHWPNFKPALVQRNVFFWQFQDKSNFTYHLENRAWQFIFISIELE